jgi:hypothetical protein
MDGNAWTTLCAAPLKSASFFPSALAKGQVKGWGCFLLDTYLNTVAPAGEAISEPWTETCGGFRWLTTPSGGYGLGFNFERRNSGGDSILLIDADKVRNSGAEGRKMDGDLTAPNGDSVMVGF